MLPAEPRPADGRAWTSRPSVSAVLAAGWPPNSRCRPPPPLAVIGIAERAIKGLVLGLYRDVQTADSAVLDQVIPVIYIYRNLAAVILTSC